MLFRRAATARRDRRHATIPDVERWRAGLRTPQVDTVEAPPCRPSRQTRAPPTFPPGPRARAPPGCVAFCPSHRKNATHGYHAASSRRVREHLVEHRLGQTAGERVLLGDVVAAEQRQTADRLTAAPCAKLRPRPRRVEHPHRAMRPRRTRRGRRSRGRARAARARRPATAGSCPARRAMDGSPAARTGRRRSPSSRSTTARHRARPTWADWRTRPATAPRTASPRTGRR